MHAAILLSCPCLRAYQSCVAVSRKFMRRSKSAWALAWRRSSRAADSETGRYSRGDGALAGESRGEVSGERAGASVADSARSLPPRRGRRRDDSHEDAMIPAVLGPMTLRAKNPSSMSTRRWGGQWREVGQRDCGRRRIDLPQQMVAVRVVAPDARRGASHTVTWRRRVRPRTPAMHAGACGRSPWALSPSCCARGAASWLARGVPVCGV